MDTHIAAVSVALLGAILAGGWLSAAELKPGDVAPDFTLAGSDGKIHNLVDFRGKQAVVLAWFPKAFTAYCTAECKSLRTSGEALRALDVAYFAASCDDAETNKKFAESLELDFPILSDPGGQVAKSYGVVDFLRRWPRRWTFYISSEGKILEIDKSVRSAEHGKDVAARLKELGVPERK